MKNPIFFITILFSILTFSQTEKYSYLSEEQEGLFEVVHNEKIGFINKKGKVIIPFQYDIDTVDLRDKKFEILEKIDGIKELQVSWTKERRSFFDGLCAVFKNGKYGYINKNNKTIIPFIYESADSFHNGIAIVIKEENYGVIDTKGNIIIDFIYDRLFRDDSNGKVFTIKQGEIIYVNLP